MENMEKRIELEKRGRPAEEVSCNEKTVEQGMTGRTAAAT